MNKKVKLKEKEIVDVVYSEEQKKQLVEEIFKKAKAVNQQMLRIERNEAAKKGSYAYMIAQAKLKEDSSIRSGSKKGKKIETLRFEESKKSLENKSVEELNKELYELNKFKKSKTSKITGIKEVRKTKEEATLEYAKSKINVDLNKKEYDKLIKAFENLRVSKLLDKNLGSERKFKALAKAIKGTHGDLIISALQEAEEYLKTNEDAYKPKVKTEEQAEILNEIFGNREIFGFQDFAPTLTDGLNIGSTKTKFGGGLI